MTLSSALVTSLLDVVELDPSLGQRATPALTLAPTNARTAEVRPT
jgi:hypothetical protein